MYTMAPVFSLVLDEDVSADIALMYPELYRDLMKVHINSNFVRQFFTQLVTFNRVYFRILLKGGKCLGPKISGVYYKEEQANFLGGQINPGGPLKIKPLS